MSQIFVACADHKQIRAGLSTAMELLKGDKVTSTIVSVVQNIETWSVMFLTDSQSWLEI